MKKKLVLLLVMLLSSLTSSFAVEVQIGGLWYIINTNTNKKEAIVISSKNDIQYRGDIVIPPSVKYQGVVYKVTSIGIVAFENCSGLTSITIPNGVTNIGESAFYGCSGLTSITIPNGVTNIGKRTFNGCSSLTSITIPNSVTNIGESAFWSCESLTSITIPNSVTNIGEHTFYNCSSLTSITIPNSVTSIGGSAFQYCSSLTSITIPYGVTNIDKSTFYGCSSLTSVTIPNSVKSICECSFWGCISLQSITIPNSVETIGNGAFYDCPKLKSVTIPAKAELVDNRAFSSYTTVRRGGTNPSSPTTTTSSTLYSGYYTQTGKRYCYNATSYDDIGTASLHNVTITNSEITVDNKTYARSGADGNWIHYGTQEGNHPIYLYNTATGDLKSRDIFKFYGLIVTDIFWVRGDQVALHRNAGTLSPVITTSPTIPTTTTTTTPTRQPHTCGYCNGTGYIMTDQGVTNFGYGTTTKYQKTCPSCGGKGVW